MAFSVRIAAYFMHAGAYTCEAVACRLGIRDSTVSLAVQVVGRKTCQQYKDIVSFPISNEDVRSAMKGFKSIADLPSCVGAVDDTHIPWLMCPSDE